MTPTIEDVLRKYMLNDGRADIIYFEDAVKAMTEYASLNRQGWFGEWQCCPVCDGNGQILADGFISSIYQQCPTCSGQRMIQKPFNESIEPCATSSEKELLEQVNDMCIESLPPELFEQWEVIKSELFKNRKIVSNG